MPRLIAIIAIVLAYSCSRYSIVQVQDFAKDSKGNWVKRGQPYDMPDTLTIVHGYIWHKVKGKKVYGY
jgi:hypothetical protein